MADSRFFTLKGPFSIKNILEATGSSVSEGVDVSLLLKDVAPLDKAGLENLSFFDNKKYLDGFKTTKAAACFVKPEFVTEAPKDTICIINKNPYKAYAIAAAMFYPDDIDISLGISDKAIISNTAKIGNGTVIKAGVIIEDNVEIGDNCLIDYNTVILKGVKIGNNVRIGSNASIQCALIGNDVVIYPNAVIGRPGFGFAIDYSTGFTSVPQLGRVVIEDKVYVGANTTIDRGAGPDTVIGQGTRIDNLVQVAHNVQIGKYCVITAQVGFAGSSKIGDFVMFGGQSGVAGHLSVGSGVRIGGKCGVIKDIPAGQGVEYMGTPAIPIKQYMRQAIMLAKLVKDNRSRNKDDK